MPGEAPEQYVRRIALDKARASFELGQRAANEVVLGADTEVVLDGRVLGKPFDSAHACAILAGLSGRQHEVISAVALVRGALEEVVTNITRVHFRALTVAEIQDYVNTGEAADKAGAYGLQGRAQAFIESIEGSHTGVIGLPMCETAALLERFGVLPSWRRR
jgi:septum formation protein